MKYLHSALENIARRDIPQNTDLWPQLAAQLHKRKSFLQTLRARPVMAIIIILIALLLLTGVAYAVGNLLGYIPGVGFVQTGSLRVLAEPASQTRQGITVTIEQVIVDPQRTVIVYKAEGLTIQAANSKGEGGGPFGSQHLLRLPDGTTLQETPAQGYAGTPEPLIGNPQTQGGWPNYVWRLVYPSVSAQTNQLTLLIPVLQNMPAGAAPENWEIPFHLKPAPADMTFAAITELAPQTAPGTTKTPSAEVTGNPGLSNTASLHGFTFKLNSVIEVDDGFVFTGNLSWSDSVFPTGKGLISNPPTPILTDAGGQKIPMEAVQLDAPFSSYENNIPWSYRTNRKAFSGPLTLSLESVEGSLFSPEDPFEWNLGSSPHIGQVWEINRDFVFAGHTSRLLTISMVAPGDTCSQAGLVFEFKNDVADINYTVTDLVPEPTLGANQTCSGGGGGGGPVDPMVSYTEASYRTIPSGLHRFSLGAALPYLVNGPWQVTWNPPASSAPTATTQPEACLTADKWNRSAGQADALPSGLGGRIVTTVDEGGLLPVIYVTNLDGSNARKIDTGAWPAISANGTHLGYSGEKGITVVDLATGESSPFSFDGYGLAWSPDGTRLMYTNTFSLFVVNADGSGQQKIDTGAAQVISPAGWLPDNHTIVYATMGGNGFTLTTTDLQSGATKRLFSFQNKAGFAAISPDGQWVAFADRVFGAQNWGIFISRLDGSQRRQLTSTDIGTAFASVWSPDGQWLVIDVANQPDLDTPALLNPFTCQVVRLEHAKGSIEGWGR